MLVISSPGSRPLLSDCLDRLRACGVRLSACELRFTVSGAKRRITAVRSRELPSPDRQVILLETLVSTGMHLAHVQQWLLQRGVSILDVAVLCARSGPGVICSRMDYVGFEAPNHVLAGYGLQLRS